MIFNELTYYLLFLFPSVAVFHLLGRTRRATAKARQAWTLATFGVLFFAWFSHKHLWGAARDAGHWYLLGAGVLAPAPTRFANVSVRDRAGGGNPGTRPSEAGAAVIHWQQVTEQYLKPYSDLFS